MRANALSCRNQRKMSDLVFSRSLDLGVPVGALREWHFRPGAFARLNPPWERARVIEAPETLHDGARAIIEVGIGPLKRRWVAVHELNDEGFVDRQASGPFAAWEHRHRFEAIDETSSRLTDEIRYRLPLGSLGRRCGAGFVARKLERMFRYRHAVTKADLERTARDRPPRAMRVLVSGATGLIGSSLVAYLETQGHEVLRLTRRPARAGDLAWDPAAGRFDLDPETRLDAVIHLAGENVASGRWTEARRRRIRESRTMGTRLLAEAIARLEARPAAFVCASGSGYYPLDGQNHDENSPAGSHFLARVCLEWEGAAAPAREAGIRTVHARIGMVLSPAGGALRKLLPLFRSGLGGPLGTGHQRHSWIALDDVLDLLHRATWETAWEGPLNFTAPESVSNTDFSRTLARVLDRPAFFRTPAPLLRAAFGSMAEETVLAEVAAVPLRLLGLGYRFRHPTLGPALAHLLGRDLPSRP